MKEILFLCQHGGAKSVIAASHFNRLAADRGLPFVATAAAAEDPYGAVPAPVADYLSGERLDVRDFPRSARTSAFPSDGTARCACSS